VRGEANETDAFAEGLAFKFLKIASMAVGERLALGNVHLAVQDIHAGDTEVSRFIHDGFDGDFGIAKVPIRVGAETEFEWWLSRGNRFGGASAESNRGGERGGGREEVAAVHSELRRE